MQSICIQFVQTFCLLSFNVKRRNMRTPIFRKRGLDKRPMHEPYTNHTNDKSVLLFLRPDVPLAQNVVSDTVNVFQACVLLLVEHRFCAICFKLLTTKVKDGSRSHTKVA